MLGINSMNFHYFLLLSFIILLVPICFFLWSISKKYLIKTTLIMLLVHIIWLALAIYDQVCLTQACFESKGHTSGIVLIISKLLPLIILLFAFPWYIGVFLKLKRYVSNTDV